MNNMNDYTEVKYPAFQKAMDEKFTALNVKEIEIAMKVGLKSVATVKNAFRKDVQVVSDEVMSRVMDIIGLDGFVVWRSGKRFYYIKP